EDVPELRPRLEAELDQVVPVHRQVSQPVRARTLLLHDLAEPGEALDLLARRRLAVGAALAEQVCVLVVEEVERDLVAVATEETHRPALVALPRLEHVTTHDSHDALPQRGRIPEPKQRLRSQVRPDLVVPVGCEAGLRVVVEASVVPAPPDNRLAEVVEE